jgi:protein involved in polysaccharide export with SLBB domain
MLQLPTRFPVRGPASRLLGAALCIVLLLGSGLAQEQKPNDKPLEIGQSVYVSVRGKVVRQEVRADGSVDAPVIGRVVLAGKTVSEASDQIIDLWRARQLERQPSFEIESPRGADALIQVGDELTLRVAGRTCRKEVGSDGSVEVPLVGKIRVTGVTPSTAVGFVVDDWRSKQTVRVYVQRDTGWVKHGWTWLGLVILIWAAMALIIFGMTRMSTRLRRWIIATVVFVAGAFWAIEFFFPTGTFGSPPESNFLTPRITDVVAPFANVLGGILLGLGVYSLLRVHGGRLWRLGPNWFFSLILLLCIPIMAIVVLVYRLPENPYVLPQFWRDAHEALFMNLFAPMEAGMFSLIAFFIMSAAYRAFRLRSIEASIMMIAALIVFLGLLPLGQAMTGYLPEEGVFASLRMENLAQWLLQTVNTPALRAIEFGIGVGVLAMSLRIWLNIERGALFD